jgi:hypothetical protein
VDEIFAALEATPLAQYLRVSRWGYAALNTTHVLAMALLVGAVMVLNLRLLGLWRSISRAAVVRAATPVAATGLALAILTGPLLFSMRASEYAPLDVFRVKLVLIALGTLAALELHRAYGWDLEGASDRRVAVHAAISSACWIGALICGRLIAFVME